MDISGLEKSTSLNLGEGHKNSSDIAKDILAQYQSRKTNKPTNETTCDQTSLLPKSCSKPVDTAYKGKKPLSSHSLTSLLQDDEQICCPNLFLGWLLSEMKCESHSGINIQFDKENKVITFHSEDEEKNAWCSAIKEECQRVSNHKFMLLFY